MQNASLNKFEREKLICNIFFKVYKIQSVQINCLCAPKLTSVEIFNVGDSFYPDARGMYIK